jgi:TP901 family phage tail tape measure protein
MSTSASTTAASFAKFTLGAAGIGSVGAALTTAASAATNFDSAMGTVNTLIAGNIPLQQELRAKILQLNPALGSSADLAKGLYAALSAGVEPAKAVDFVAVAAQAATAGLTDMGVATDAMAKVMRAFGLQTEEANVAADTMFQTVNLGAGTFEEFSRAFATVASTAAASKLSLNETAATLATLSFAFPSAAEAGTGFNAILRELNQNSQKLKAVGIDVQKQLAEEGLTGVMKRLKVATGGNTQAIMQLGFGHESLRAVLALTGEQALIQAENLEKMGQKTGASLAAFEERSKTADAAWKTFTNSLDRFINTTAPSMLEQGSSILKWMTDFVQGAGNAEKAQSSLNTAQQMGGNFSRALSEIWARVKKDVDDLAEGAKIMAGAFTDQAKAIDQSLGITRALGGALNEASEGYAAIVPTVKELNSILSEQQKRMQAAVQADKDAAKARADLVAKNTELALKANEAAFALQDAAKATDTFAKSAESATMISAELATGMDKLGIKSKAALVEAADQAKKTFGELLTNGQTTIAELNKAWPKVRDAAIAAYGKLPPEFAALEAQLKAKAAASGETISGTWKTAARQTEQAWTDAYGHIQTETSSAVYAWVHTIKEGASDAFGHLLRTGTFDAWGHAIKEGASDAFGHLVRTGKEAATEVGESFKTMATDVTSSMTSMRNFVTTQLGAPIQGISTKIADTLPELEKQYTDTLNAISRIGPDPMGAVGWADTQRRVLQDLLTRIGAKLDELRAKGLAAGTALAPVAGTPPISIHSTAGGLGGGGFSPFNPGILSGTSGIGGTTSRFTSTGGTGMGGRMPPPLPPSSGSAGYAPPTPNGPVNFAPQIVPTGVPGKGANIQVNVHGDTDPERTVRRLMPALREAVRRGELTR